VDQLIASVPVVNQVVPAEPVATVVSPVVNVAEEVANGLAEPLLPPVAETLPVLDNVLPITGLIPDIAGEPPVPAAPAASLGLVGGQLVPPESAEITDSSVTVSWGFPTLNSWSMPARTWLAVTSAEAPAGGDPVPFDGDSEPPGPQSVPGVPGSGSGSGESPGSSGAAGCLPGSFFALPQLAAVPAFDHSQHAPAPVSFDPGSSPD
jgi:hypothetical protein